MSTNGYIEWAQFWCPEPLSSEPVSLQEAAAIYDDVDNRLGDDAEEDDFFARVMWLETAIRLAQVGWTVPRLEDARWPVPNTANVLDLMREL
jgi:hypothetical protein